jgi:hypothetical protein
MAPARRPRADAGRRRGGLLLPPLDQATRPGAVRRRL